MSDKEQISDQDIDNYFDGKDELSSIYKNSKELKTPDHLEFSVKRLAREAEQQDSGNTDKRNKPWLIPFSLAASFLLAFALFFELNTNTHKEKIHTAEIKPIEQETQIIKETEREPKVIAKTPESTKLDESSSQAEQEIVQSIEKFELPEHLKDMIQSTHRSGDNELLPHEILKTWTKQQWKQQILDLQKDGNTVLANKYLKAYTKYYPGTQLELTE